MHMEAYVAPLDSPPAPKRLLDVRIIAIVAVFVAGLIGGLLPVLHKCFHNAAHPATLLLRALSAGVILSLAVIHILPDGISDLGELSDYPYASVCAVFGVLCMVALEDIVRSLLSNMHTHGGAGADSDPLKPTHSHHAREPVCPAPRARQHSDAAPTASCQGDGPDHSASAAGGGAGGVASGDGHTHTCISVNNAANWASNPQGLTVRNQVMAYMIELGCVVHSVLIGIALGVTVDKCGQAVALTVALVFHQGLEGIGLGSAIVKACFTTGKAVAMVVTYAVMTPLGIAIGMALAGSYDPESTTALGVQGALNSFSAGMLLYIALVQLIAEDFTRADVQGSSVWFRVIMHGALALGAACMAVIANWN